MAIAEIGGSGPHPHPHPHSHPRPNPNPNPNPRLGFQMDGVMHLYTPAHLKTAGR